MRMAFLTALLAATAVLAKPWNGIDPGTSHREEVVKKFGPPSKVTTMDGKEVLAYFQKEAIKGTTQAQFKVDPSSKLVERIDIFPAPVIDREAIEGSYGPACPSSGTPPTSPCYVKKVSEDFRTYFHYSSVGLAVFFREDGKTVHSFIFQPAKQK